MARDVSFFTTIKEQVDLEDYLTKQLGVELVPDGAGRMAAVCPFHEEDTPSFKMMESDDGPWKRWYCFGACQEGGTVIDAVMKQEGFEVAHEAAQWLNEVYGLGLDVNSEAYQRFARTVAETRGDIDRTRKAITAETATAKAARTYLHRRGFTDETIENFQLGVDTSKTKAGRLSIPLIDKANHPVSVANRALFDSFACRVCKEKVAVKEVVKQRFEDKKAEAAGEKVDPDHWKRCPRCGAPGSEAKVAFLIGQNPKYLYIRDFDKANFLYNEHGTRGVLSKDREVLGLFLVEGYADVWACWQSGHKAICAYNGAQLSDWQANEVTELVDRAGKPVILVPDFDEAGSVGIYKNVEKLRAAKEDIEIQIVYGVDELTYEEDGETKRCKDLGDVLKHHGAEKVAALLEQNRWQAAEWQIRQIVEAKNARTGEPFHSMSEQLRICAEILSEERSKVALDHLIPYLVEQWDRKEEIVRNWFYSNLSAENATSYQHLFKDIDQARVEAREFLQDDNVIPLGFDDLDQCLPGGGVRPGQLSMWLGKSGTGKAQPLDARVLTPRGWKLMGEIEVGDTVVDPEGGHARVQGVFPQGEREIFKVTFSDGSSTECDIEHLWKVRDSNRKWKIKTLKEIVERVDLGKSPHFIPMTQPISFESSAPLPLDPYLLGVLLGDAGFTNSNVILSCADLETLETIRPLLPSGVKINKIQGDNVDWSLTRAVDNRKGANPLTQALRDLDLMGLGSEEKFIPENYLHAASAEHRLALLKGLMDTDGSVVKQSSSNGVYLEFCSCSKRLADGVLEIARSLGGTGRIAASESGYRCSKTGKKKTCKTRYRTRLTLGPEINPFRLTRKASRYNRKWAVSRRIVAVEAVGHKQAQCISLDSASQLYVTDDYVVTHNTMLSTQILANMADHGVSAIIFTLEQAAKSLFPRLVCQALDITPAEAEELIARDDPEAEAALRPVHDLYKNLLIIDNVPGEGESETLQITPSRVQAIIQEANMTYFAGKPAQVVAIDHLGILEVDADAPREIKGSENMRPGYIMQRLFAVCKQTNVFMMVLQQLPKEIAAGVAFGYDSGRGGSAQTDFCDFIFQIHRPEQQQDLDDTERAQYAGQYKLTLGKNRFGPSRVAHLMFDKSTLRIMPVVEVTQPDHQNPEGVIDVGGEGGAMIDASGATHGATPESAAAPVDASTDAGMAALLERSPDTLPDDTAALLDSLGDDEDPDQLGDPALRKWFEA